MGKIVIIGVGDAGRTVLKKLKDEGLQDVEMMSFDTFPDDDREDIPHHNLITMNGHCGLGRSLIRRHRNPLQKVLQTR